MKNLKKISALILLVCAICVGFVVTSLAEEYTGTVDGLNGLVANLDTASDVYASLDEVAAYIPTVDPAADGYEAAVSAAKAKAATVLGAKLDAVNTSAPKTAEAELVKVNAAYQALELDDATVLGKLNTAALAVAQGYYAGIQTGTVTNTATNQVAINRFNAFVKLGICDEASDDYMTLMANANVLFDLQEDAVEANRQAMLAESAMSDYDLATIISGTMNDGANPFPTKDEKGNCKITVKDGALHITTYAQSNATSAYVQKSGFSNLSTKGIVIDFDFANLGETMTRFHLEGGGHTSLKDGTRVFPSYMVITAAGNVTAGNNCATDANKVFLEDAIVNGEWLHFTIIFNPNAYTYSLYCEYQHLGTYSAEISGGHRVNLDIARFATDTNPSGGHHGFDNVQIYQGDSLRDLGMFERMTDEEKFVYYANYYTNDESDDTVGRYTSLKNVETLKSKYVDENGAFKPFAQGNLSDEDYADMLQKVEAAVNKINTYDSAEFIANLRVSNREIFIGYVNEAVKIDRVLTTDNINERIKASSEIESFLLSIDGNIDDGEGYKAAIDAYNEFVSNSNMDKNILEFNKYIDIYQKVDSLNSLRKYYAFAQKLFEDPDYPIDPALADMPGFESFKAAYEVYVAGSARIEAVERDQNSKKIVSCYALICDVAKEEWEANYEYMNPYVIMIREVRDSGYYNFDYSGVDKVLDEFEDMDKFFYDLLQQEHIDELTAMLDFVKNNDAYIEKMGTLSYIGRYLESNDVDRTIPEIQTLIANYETALEELSFREADYETVLTQNAAYFVALVEKMRISNDFNEKRELHARATEFYFALDARYEGAAEAILVYDEHTLYFETGEIASKLFLDAVVILRAATTDEEKYAALVDCYTYSLDAVATYTGVAEAMEFYQAEYDAYSNAASSTIEVIESMGVTVASVRSNCGVDAIIAVIIKKIFG